jgi:hypothetical protein
LSPDKKDFTIYLTSQEQLFSATKYLSRKGVALERMFCDKEIDVYSN